MTANLVWCKCSLPSQAFLFSSSDTPVQSKLWTHSAISLFPPRLGRRVPRVELRSEWTYVHTFHRELKWLLLMSKIFSVRFVCSVHINIWVKRGPLSISAILENFCTLTINPGSEANSEHYGRRGLPRKRSNGRGIELRHWGIEFR